MTEPEDWTLLFGDAQLRVSEIQAAIYEDPPNVGADYDTMNRHAIMISFARRATEEAQEVLNQLWDAVKAVEQKPPASTVAPKVTRRKRKAVHHG